MAVDNDVLLLEITHTLPQTQMLSSWNLEPLQEELVQWREVLGVCRGGLTKVQSSWSS